MTKRLVLLCISWLGALALVTGCGPSSTVGPPGGLGPDGGTVTGPNGAEAIVPAGALSSEVTIAIASPGVGAPAFPPPGVTAVGSVYEFTPHGQAFSSPVKVRIPFDASLVPADETPRLYHAEPGGSFSEVSGATVSGSFLEAEVGAFSYFAPGVPQLQTYEIGGDQPTHLSAYPGGSLLAVGLVGDGTGWVSLVAPNGTVTWRASFAADYTSALSGPRVAAGPTGNVYVLAATTKDEAGASLGGRSDVRVTSFDPQGQERAGWPQRLRVGYSNWPAAVAVDAQDRVLVYGGGSAQSTTSHDSFRPWLASFSSSGVAIAAPAPVTFGGTEPSRRILPADMALKAAGGLYLTARVVGFSSASDMGTGVQVASLDATGMPVSGFPVRLSMDAPYHGAPVALGTNDDVFVLGAQLYGLTSDAIPLTGLPAALGLGDSDDLSHLTQPGLSLGLGNAYFAGESTDRAGGAGGVDVFVQGLTSAGATLANFPRYLGTEDDDFVASSALDSAGRLWLLWYSDGATRKAFLTRMPGN